MTDFCITFRGIKMEIGSSLFNLPPLTPTLTSQSVPPVSQPRDSTPPSPISHHKAGESEQSRKGDLVGEMLLKQTKQFCF